MKKVTIAIMAILTVGIISFVSCNKDNETINSGNIPAKSTGNPNPDLVHIATGNINSGVESVEFVCDLESFEQEYNQVLADSLGSNYIFNDMIIVDDTFPNQNTAAYLAISIVDVNEGTTTTYFAPISKEINGNNIYYYGNRRGKITVICTGHNCQGGCTINSDGTGCTPCNNQQGTCDSQVIYEGETGGPSAWEVSGVLLSALGILVTVLVA